MINIKFTFPTHRHIYTLKDSIGHVHTYTETTADPSQDTPFHDSAHGSPPLDFQPVSCDGLFSDVYRTWSDWTALWTRQISHLS